EHPQLRPLGPPARSRPQVALADREQPGQGVSGDAGLGERRLHQRDGAPAQHARPVDVGAPGAGPHRLAHDPRALTRAVALMAAEPTWLRVAELFIPASLRRDAEAPRRARTAVYLCAVPVLTSFGSAWKYWQVLPDAIGGGVAAMVLGTNVA